MQPTKPEKSVKVFIGYAHADQELRQKLEEHLSSLCHSGEILIWKDQEIPAGANWEDQINTHLNSADLILLLVSASFIASQYCWSKELQVALSRHQAGTARVIPIILRPTLWQNTPLGQLQALPRDAKPITQWADSDIALEDVAQGIRKVVEELRILFREEARQKEEVNLLSEKSAAKVQPTLDPGVKGLKTRNNSQSGMNSRSKETSALTGTDEARSRTRSNASLSQIPAPSLSPPPFRPLTPTRKRPLLSRRNLLVVVVLILLVLFSGLGVDLFITHQFPFAITHHPPLTATPSYRSATAISTAATSATATSTPAISTPAISTPATEAIFTYDDAVNANGIQPGFDAHDSSFNPYESFLTPNNVSKLTPGWTFSTNQPVVGMPIVTSDAIYITTYDDMLYALKTDGTKLWSTHVGSNNTQYDQGLTPPTVAYGLVFVGSVDEGKIYVFQPNTCHQDSCQPVWEGNAGSGLEPSNVTFAHITVADHTIYTVAARPPTSPNQSTDYLTAFSTDGCNQATCDPLWTVPTIFENGTVDGDTIFAASEYNNLYVFRKSQCAQGNCNADWSSHAGDGAGPGAISGDFLYTGDAGHQFDAFNIKGCHQTLCSPAWSAQTSDVGPVAVTNTFVYTAGRSLFVFNTSSCNQSTCQPAWTASISGISSLFIAGNVVYALASNISQSTAQNTSFSLYAFNANGCNQSSCPPLWTKQVPIGPNDALANSVHNGSLYQGSIAVANGTLYYSSWNGLRTFQIG